MAIANHGGGHVIIGFSETERGFVEADRRPPSLDQYSQDNVSGIVQRYCDPPFQCAVYIGENPEKLAYPVILVPGGHVTPVMSKRASSCQKVLIKNSIYTRLPGPRSDFPQSKKDWDDLLARCLQNRRSELLDHIRSFVYGYAARESESSERERLDIWVKNNFERWKVLKEKLPNNSDATFPFGDYCFAYEITGNRKSFSPSDFQNILQESVVRHTGWPPFWYPTRSGIRPYMFNDAVECWIGGDEESPTEERDAAHADFWRIDPKGLAFLLRGYQEDSVLSGRKTKTESDRGMIFDVTLPVWRAGEALFHSASLAKRLFEGPTNVRFFARYTGLMGRKLSSTLSRYNFHNGGVARQNSINLQIDIGSDTITENLPEVVRPLLAPLHALFDFFELRMEFVATELARMRENRF